ncbi:MAG TPA: transcription antitermination factor NusB [Candidatus Monoglobus merdigallinarum]|uniref:Transcription antitermination protein NusB n=1 Tax=Candidatus Monoglobus merdigallinarum TaxID=2838698 RepID=A0A9D1TKX9_9FIRM|nr:transcription antitermination factor NusB [Candidatus Monoglobus merdigallinarum]
MDRKKAREYAFTILFQYKFRPDDISAVLSDFFLEHDAGNQGEYIGSVVAGVVKNIEEIDKKIEEFSRVWTVDRMDSVNLAALRLGVYEMLYMDDIPLAVTISEAATLARRFAGEEAAAFVNGVLGGIQKQLEAL